VTCILFRVCQCRQWCIVKQREWSWLSAKWRLCKAEERLVSRCVHCQRGAGTSCHLPPAANPTPWLVLPCVVRSVQRDWNELPVQKSVQFVKCPKQQNCCWATDSCTTQTGSAKYPERVHFSSVLSLSTCLYCICWLCWGMGNSEWSQMLFVMVYTNSGTKL